MTAPTNPAPLSQLFAVADVNRTIACCRDVLALLIFSFHEPDSECDS